MNNANTINQVKKMLTKSIQLLNNVTGNNAHVNNAHVNRAIEHVNNAVKHMNNAVKHMNNVENTESVISDFQNVFSIVSRLHKNNHISYEKIGAGSVQLYSKLRKIRRIRDENDKIMKFKNFMKDNWMYLKPAGVSEELINKYVPRNNRKFVPRNNGKFGGAKYVNLKNVGRRLVRLSKTGRQYAVVNGRRKYL